MTSEPPLVREVPGGVILAVHAKPGARQDKVIGLREERLAISVTAAPDAGKANSALSALLAKQLGVAKSSCSVTAGRTSRKKSVTIIGISAKAIEEWLSTFHN